MRTKTAGLLLILSVFAFACGKEEQKETKASQSGETATSVGTKAETANAEEAPKNLLVMQYYALPG